MIKEINKDPIITNLFLEQFRSEEFKKICKEIFKDIKYCYVTLDGILSENKATIAHMNTSHRANSLLLALKVIKMVLKEQVRYEYQSKEMRESRFASIEKEYSESVDYVFRASRGLSAESGYILYDKCRSFNTARLNGLKRNNPWSSDYIDKIITILNEHKYSKND